MQSRTPRCLTRIITSSCACPRPQPHHPRALVLHSHRPLPQIPRHHLLGLVPQRRLLQSQQPEPLHRRAPHHIALVLGQERHRSSRPQPLHLGMRHPWHHQPQMPPRPRLLHRHRLQQSGQLIRISLERPPSFSVIRRATSAARFLTSTSSPKSSRTSARTPALSPQISSAIARARPNPHAPLPQLPP